MTALEVGLLTRGSAYWPTPSQPSTGQWPILLAFVPAYSGASVRDLHPLPEHLTSRARTTIDPNTYHPARHMSSIDDDAICELLPGCRTSLAPPPFGSAAGMNVSGPGSGGRKLQDISTARPFAIQLLSLAGICRSVAPFGVVRRVIHPLARPY